MLMPTFPRNLVGGGPTTAALHKDPVDDDGELSPRSMLLRATGQLPEQKKDAALEEAGAGGDSQQDAGRRSCARSATTQPQQPQPPHHRGKGSWMEVSATDYLPKVFSGVDGGAAACGSGDDDDSDDDNSRNRSGGSSSATSSSRSTMATDHTTHAATNASDGYRVAGVAGAEEEGRLGEGEEEFDPLFYDSIDGKGLTPCSIHECFRLPIEESYIRAAFCPSSPLVAGAATADLSPSQIMEQYFAAVEEEEECSMDVASSTLPYQDLFGEPNYFGLQPSVACPIAVASASAPSSSGAKGGGVFGVGSIGAPSPPRQAAPAAALIVKKLCWDAIESANKVIAE